MDDVADTAELLEDDGHEVQVAHTGPAALEAAATFRPDVVLLDIGMPGMDGHEVARRLRRDPATASTLPAAVTGYGREEDLRQARAAGFDDHLVKPVVLGALQRLLDAVGPA